MSIERVRASARWHDDGGSRRPLPAGPAGKRQPAAGQASGQSSRQDRALRRAAKLPARATGLAEGCGVGHGQHRPHPAGQATGRRPSRPPRAAFGGRRSWKRAYPWSPRGDGRVFRTENTRQPGVGAGRGWGRGAEKGPPIPRPGRSVRVQTKLPLRADPNYVEPPGRGVGVGGRRLRDVAERRRRARALVVRAGHLGPGERDVDRACASVSKVARRWRQQAAASRWSGREKAASSRPSVWAELPAGQSSPPSCQAACKSDRPG